jgi:hypothetical protein
MHGLLVAYVFVNVNTARREPQDPLSECRILQYFFRFVPGQLLKGHASCRLSDGENLEST